MNKSNKLKQVLRQMIREEVTDQVNKAMGKILVEVLKEARNIPVSQPTPVEEETASTAFLKPTGNAALDSVLAETARTHTHLPSGNEGVSLAQLMGDGFDKIGKK